MNKLIFSIALVFIMLSACTTSSKTEIIASQTADKITTVPAKKTKHRHSLPEGIISVDIVNYNNRLHLLTGKNHQRNKTLWYQFSDDGGLNWSLPSKVLNSDKLSVKMVRGNDAQITAQGSNIVITWTKHDKNMRFHAGQMMAARSSNAGLTWQYSVAPPDWVKGSHGFIDLTADQHAMHAVWLDGRNGNPEKIKASQSLLYAKSIDGGKSWLPNKILDSSSCSCCWNTIKTQAGGKAYVLYRDKEPSDMSIGTVDRKQQWQRLNHVGAFDWQFEGCPHIGGGIDFQTTAQVKRLHAVVGTGHQKTAGVFYLYSNDEGKSWSKTVQLGDESALHGDVAAHNNGRVIAVWDMRNEEGDLAVFAAESKDQGKSWSAAKQLSNAGNRATHPRVVKTADGFLALWTENDGQKQTLETKRL